MEGRAQANTTHGSLLPSLQGSGKKIKSGYFIATPRISTESVSSCTTTCSASLTFPTNLLFHLLDNIYLVTKRILALSWLWFQKQSYARAYKFAQYPALLSHQHRLANVTCAWRWRLCGITPTLLTLYSVIRKHVEGRNCVLIYDTFLEETKNHKEISDQGCRCQNSEAYYYEADCFVSSLFD